MTGLHCFVLVILASSRSNGLRLRTRCFDISCLSRGGVCVAVPGSQTMIAGIFRRRPQDCDCEPMLYARSRIVNAAARLASQCLTNILPSSRFDPGCFIISRLDIQEKPERIAFTFRDLRKMGWAHGHGKIS